MKDSTRMKTKKTTSRSNLRFGREQLLPFRDLMDPISRIEYDKLHPVMIISPDNLDWALEQNPSFIFRVVKNPTEITKTNCDVPIFDWVASINQDAAARYIYQKLQDTCMISNYLLIYTGAEYARSASSRIRINC